MAQTGLRRSGRGGALTKFDPGKGVKEIAVAKVAAKYFEKAKNTDEVFRAIAKKWAAQADFVEWWDTTADRLKTQRHAGPGRGKTGVKLADKKATEFSVKPEDFGLDVKTLSRWRTKTRTAADLKRTVADECEAARMRIECLPRTTHAPVRPVNGHAAPTPMPKPQGDDLASIARSMLACGVIEILAWPPGVASYERAEAVVAGVWPQIGDPLLSALRAVAGWEPTPGATVVVRARHA